MNFKKKKRSKGDRKFQKHEHSSRWGCDCDCGGGEEVEGRGGGGGGVEWRKGGVSVVVNRTKMNGMRGREKRDLNEHFHNLGSEVKKCNFSDF